METYVVKLPVLFQRRAQTVRQQGQNIRTKAAVCVVEGMIPPLFVYFS